MYQRPCTEQCGESVAPGGILVRSALVGVEMTEWQDGLVVVGHQSGDFTPLRCLVMLADAFIVLGEFGGVRPQHHHDTGATVGPLCRAPQHADH